MKILKSTLDVPEFLSSNSTDKSTQKLKPVLQIVWRNVLLFTILHAGAVYGIYRASNFEIKMFTWMWVFFLIYLGSTGTTAGAHRLWAHKTYKAKWPLRLILMFCQTIAFQNHIFEWSRDHRVHHKFCDTDADPHNSKRGFFFSHIGWLMVKKHDQVKIKGKLIDMSDLEKDEIVMFQKRHYMILLLLCHLMLPIIIPWYVWDENFWNSFFAAYFFRYTFSLHITWLVNSVAHRWGMKTYNKNISPTDNLTIGILAFGEGWHNYHHTFPWDYKSSEFGDYKFNFTTAFIDFFSKIGWAYDLKTASPAIIKERILRTGSENQNSSNVFENTIWRLSDMPKQHKQIILSENKFNLAKAT